MEEGLFHEPAVAGLLEDEFIEARLHTDGKKNRERILELQEQLTGSVAIPYYLVIDPSGGITTANFEGYTADPQRFADFLERGRREALATL